MHVLQPPCHVQAVDCLILCTATAGSAGRELLSSSSVSESEVLPLSAPAE